MEKKDPFENPWSVSRAAQYLGVPPKWLRQQVESGHLPGLIADKSALVDVPTVGRILSERAKSGKGVPRD